MGELPCAAAFAGDGRQRGGGTPSADPAQRVPRHGADDDGVARCASPHELVRCPRVRRSRRSRRPRSTTRDRRARAVSRAAARFDERARRLGVQLIERHGGQADRGGLRRPAPNSSPSTRTNGAAAADARRLIERRDRERMPEPVAQRRATGRAPRASRHRLIRQARPPPRPRLRVSPTPPQQAAQPKRASRDRASRKRLPPQHAGQQVPRRRQSRTRQRRPIVRPRIRPSSSARRGWSGARSAAPMRPKERRRSRDSSRTARAGRCRRARRCRDRRTPSRGRPAAALPRRTTTRRPRSASADGGAAARRSRADHDDVGASGRGHSTADATPPVAQCEPRLRGRGTRHDGGEHVVVGAPRCGAGVRSRSRRMISAGDEAARVRRRQRARSRASRRSRARAA